MMGANSDAMTIFAIAAVIKASAELLDVVLNRRSKQRRKKRKK